MNIFILIITVYITNCYGHTPGEISKTLLGQLWPNHNAEIQQHNLQPNHGFLYPIILGSQQLGLSALTKPTIKPVEKPHGFLKKLHHHLFKWKKQPPKKCEHSKATANHPIILQPYPIYINKPIPVPYPVTKTVVKEVPIIQKELIPVELPAPEPVHHTVIEHTEIHPSTSTIIHHESPSETVVLDTNVKIEESVPATVLEQAHVDYGLPSTYEHQPFDQYGLPIEGIKQNNDLTVINSESHNSANTISTSNEGSDGNYSNSYILSDGTKVTEEGRLVTSSDGNEVLVKNGNYEFTDKDGTEVKVDWVADEQGFRILNP